MQKHKLAAQPIEPVEFPAVPAVAQVPVVEKWVQEEEKHKNQVPQWEHPQEKAQRLVPGFAFKRLVL